MPNIRLTEEEINYCIHAMRRRTDFEALMRISLTGTLVRWNEAWYYLPFDGGPRVCFVQQFVAPEIGYILTRWSRSSIGLVKCNDILDVRHQYQPTSAPQRVLVRLLGQKRDRGHKELCVPWPKSVSCRCLE